MNGSRKPLWTVAGGILAAALAIGPVAMGAGSDGRSESAEFGPVLSEMRSAVAHTSDLRTLSDKAGDKIKETCVYERLRGMMQAVSSAEVAQVAWESALARNDGEAAKAEVGRAQQALELVRKMRNEADNCVGKELEKGSSATGSKTIVTVESTVREDDPYAGPKEFWKVRPAVLDLPGRPIPASPF